MPEQSALSLGLSLSRECPKEPVRPMSEQHCARAKHTFSGLFTGLTLSSWSSLEPPEGV